jgi:TfdA family taurine catabolism dioxygenase TauD
MASVGPRPLIRAIRWAPDEAAHAFGRRVRQVLLGAKAVHLTGVDPEQVDLRAFYEGVQDGIGAPLRIGEDAASGEPTGERWLGIRYARALPDRYRHACVAQPLHTDYAYTADNPELALMYCERRAPSGGECLFVDGDDVVRLLEARDPPLLAELRAREVRFSKGRRAKRDRIVSSDGDGTLLTWLRTCVDPDQPSEVRDVADRFAAFIARHVETSERVIALALAPGEAVVWHDRRLLHGRSAFEAKQDGDRLLWKSGIFLARAEGS